MHLGLTLFAQSANARSWLKTASACCVTTLLLTSRYRFQLPESNGADLAEELVPHGARGEPQTGTAAAGREGECTQRNGAPGHARHPGSQGLQDLLTQAERDLLQASTLFQLPVPLDVLGRLAAGDQGTGRRLLAFGLWNAWPDPVDGQIPCAVIDPLAHRVAGELNDDEARSLAARAAGPLRSHWGNKALPDAAHELLRLGTLGQETGCILAGGTQALSRLLGRSCDAFSLLGQTDAVRQLEGLIGGA